MVILGFAVDSFHIGFLPFSKCEFRVNISAKAEEPTQVHDEDVTDLVPNVVC